MLNNLIILGIVCSATALKCYICDNFDDANCLKIEKYGSDFLEECQPYRKNTTRCAVQIEKGGDKILTRMCVKQNFICDNTKFNCHTCDTDGCNKDNEIKEPINVQLADSMDLIKYNMHLVGLVGVVLLVLVIYVVAKLRCKKKDSEYEEEDNDFDVYYENETSIDLEDEKEPPIKK